MNIIEATAKQDWKVFKALCPKEMMDIIKSPDLTPEQYRKLINAIKALGFYDIAMVFMIRRYEYVDLFINNVKNVNLQKYFEERSIEYVKLK